MNRRQFLGLAGGVLTAAVAAPLAIKQPPHSPPPRQQLTAQRNPLRGSYAGWKVPGVPHGPQRRR